METSDHDDPILKSWATLDDDLQGRLLETILTDIPLDHRLDPRRVSARAFARLGLLPDASRRHYRKLGWRYGVAAISAAIVVGMVVPNPVSATLGKVFHFVPGIGAVQKTAAGTQLAVLPNTASGVWNGTPIQVTGLMVSPNEIILEISCTGPTAPTQVALRTTAGQTIPLKGDATVGSDEQWIATYYARGTFGTLVRDQAIAIIIGGKHGGRISVKLSLAKGVRALSTLGATQTHHAVSLTAMTGRQGQEAELTLVAQYHGPFTIVSTVPSFPASARPDVQIANTSGRHYTPDQLFRLGPNDQLTFKATPGVANYEVTVPEVDATYSGHASVTLPVPAHGIDRVDRRVQLGEISFDITRVRRMHSGGWGLRFYVKGPAHSATKILHGFQVVDAPGSGGFAWKVNAKTGALQWVEVGVPQHRDSVTLQLSQAEVYIHGPWTFHVHLPAPGSKR